MSDERISLPDNITELVHDRPSCRLMYAFLEHYSSLSSICDEHEERLQGCLESGEHLKIAMASHLQVISTIDDSLRLLLTISASNTWVADAEGVCVKSCFMHILSEVGFVNLESKRLYAGRCRYTAYDSPNAILEDMLTPVVVNRATSSRVLFMKDIVSNCLRGFQESNGATFSEHQEGFQRIGFDKKKELVMYRDSHGFDKDAVRRTIHNRAGVACLRSDEETCSIEFLDLLGLFRKSANIDTF